MILRAKIIPSLKSTTFNKVITDQFNVVQHIWNHLFRNQTALQNIVNFINRLIIDYTTKSPWDFNILIEMPFHIISTPNHCHPLNPRCELFCLVCPHYIANRCFFHKNEAFICFITWKPSITLINKSSNNSRLSARCKESTLVNDPKVVHMQKLKLMIIQVQPYTMLLQIYLLKAHRIFPLWSNSYNKDSMAKDVMTDQTDGI